MNTILREWSLDSPWKIKQLVFNPALSKSDAFTLKRSFKKRYNMIKQGFKYSVQGLSKYRPVIFKGLV